MPDVDLTRNVQEKYGEIARNVREGRSGSCCSGTCGCDDPITTGHYDEGEKVLLPAEAVAATLGCGNPTAASTCCCRPGASDRPAERTGWT